ncbi:uncharacterized protein LOC126672354 [Mercurialis annua]|uniref:uncharacterized protein LOC126672354 n=1 Tax=Mercurialis annua TaxID=3986 RepID=UPI00215F9F06|nr:uncharacterized protein LOC126672354 [Mercurialis annua]
MLLGLNFPRRFIHWVMLSVRTPTYSVAIIGALYGYFKGGRGLRQGDPLSPILFVIVMDYLSRYLSSIGSRRPFKFHKGCRVLKLNHLCFADDLFLFCHGDTTSASYMKEALSHFQSVSGLHVNNEKSSIFFCNTPAHNKSIILNTMGFAEGSLPVKYLGMPLVSRRLSKIDSQCQVFILPKAVTHKIERICRSFLWKGNATDRKFGGISWDIVCSQKKNGGLGVKKVALWNRVAVLKQLWFLLTDKCSLWAHWVTLNKLKKLSYWGITKPYKASWSWRNLVKIRDSAKELFECKIGNGKSTLFWFDPWVNGKSNAKVADLHRTGVLLLPDAMDELTLQAWDFIQSNFSFNSNEDDKVLFKPGKQKAFSIKSAWSHLSPADNKVSWASLVWKAPIIQGTASLRGRLFIMVSIQETNCSDGVRWTTQTVFSAIVVGPFIWCREISWFSRKYGGRNMSNTMRRLAFCSTVYNICVERNSVIFSSIRPYIDVVFKRISFSDGYLSINRCDLRMERLMMLEDGGDVVKLV